MELWIRSQDEEKLLIAKDVRIEKHFKNRIVETDLGQEADMRNGEDIFYLLANKGTKIGEYKTKERALEVLDAIQSLVVGNTKYLITGEQVYTGIKSKDLQSLLYEMPKE